MVRKILILLAVFGLVFYINRGAIEEAPHKGLKK